MFTLYWIYRAKKCRGRRKPRSGEIAQVVAVRQRAKRGTKCYIRWQNGYIGAAWIEGQTINPGTGGRLEGFWGHGEHHNEEVFRGRF